MKHTPPAWMRSEARWALEQRKGTGGGLSTQEAGKQGIGSGVARATSLANGDALSTETVKRLKAFFSRHMKNLVAKDGKVSRGQVAGGLWGARSQDKARKAIAWADREIAKAEKE